jgi:uncharacterized membrane protein
METRNEPVLTRVPALGHSLHRWLVGIPVILYIASVTFFGLYAYDDNVMWLRDGIITNLVAVIAAVVAAIPGLMDLRAIPDAHPARSVAIGHASFMVAVLTLFVANLVVNFHVLAAAIKGSIVMYRGFDGTVALVLTGTGLGLALCGGALGLMLAHAFRIGAPVPEPTHGPLAH